jgi:hypothetical protein
MRQERIDMTETRRAYGGAADDAAYGRSDMGPSGWVGWVFFAGLMMIMVGSFEAISGLVALFKDEYYQVGKNGLVLSFDYTTWGWIHLILGVIVTLAGIGVLLGQMWARIIGIVMALLSAIANITFLAAYPIWAALIITLDVIVIYALAVHGREARRI